MFGIDDLMIVGIAAVFSALAATVGELLKKYLSKKLSRNLEIQITTPSGETIKISFDATGDKVREGEAVARALHEAQEAVSALQPTSPAVHNSQF